MRKFLLVSVIALFLMGLCADGLTASYTFTYTDPIVTSPGIGTQEPAGQSLYTPVKKFRAVRFNYHPDMALGGGGGIQDINISPDSVMIWDSSASGDDGVTVTLSTLSGDSRVAGVLVGGVSWSSADYHSIYASMDARWGSVRHWGWLQTSGIGYVLIGSNVVSGDMLSTGSHAGRACSVVDATDALYLGHIGVALDSGTSSAAGVRVKVLLKGLY